MINRIYKFSFFLNALHYLHITEQHGGVHPHTWQINLYLNKITDNFIMFTDIEEKIQQYLLEYEGKVLNDTPQFKDIEPSIENIGEIVFSQINKLLNSNEWQLNSLEISENSTRTYVITNNLAENLNRNENAINMLTASDENYDEKVDMTENNLGEELVHNEKIMDENFNEESANDDKSTREQPIHNETEENLDNTKEIYKKKLKFQGKNNSLMRVIKKILG
ncbi:6-carboxytetrahydropterin synthase [uncultured Clostridium sp.]|uniref:6-carboxytetrahydropterin synthase n=1 Tax=uncultured Clostridium sp. TaxID=59620 RepID=UPI0028E79FCF|nr:6-carboxytetrahydropterin synthase [uncultured Clostridium sp.]